MFDSYPFTPEDASSLRFKEILNWLTRNGAPAASLVTSISHPTVIEGFIENLVRFSKTSFDDFDIDAGLLLRAPSIALTDLEHHFNFGNPMIPKFFDYTPEPSQVLGKATEFPSQPSKPYGAESVEGSNIFFSAPGDVLPKGSKYTDETGTYTKYIQLTPFGPRSWWRRS